MPDAQLVAELEYRSLTRTINEIRDPWSFITNLLYGQGEILPTEQVEVGVYHGGRRMAPFVRRDAEAIPIEGTTDEFRVVAAPNIRLKMPFRAGALLFKRQAGTPVYVSSAGTARNAVAMRIARDLLHMRHHHSNRLEWMACQSLNGSITYSVSEGASFNIDFQRPAAFNVTLTGTALWTDAGSNPKTQLRYAQRLMTDNGIPNPNICVMGKLAAEAFEENAKVATLLDNRNINAGVLELQEAYRDSGARYLGRLFGIDWWEYSRTVLDETGSEVALIDDKKAHFIARSPAAGFQLYWAAIPEMQDLLGNLLVQERIFAKSWAQQDPSAVIALSHSRPLPVPERPRAVCTFKVIA